MRVCFGSKILNLLQLHCSAWLLVCQLWFVRMRVGWYPQHGGTSGAGAEVPAIGRAPRPRGGGSGASSAAAVVIQYRGAFGIPKVIGLIMSVINNC